MITLHSPSFIGVELYERQYWIIQSYVRSTTNYETFVSMIYFLYISIVQFSSTYESQTAVSVVHSFP